MGLLEEEVPVDELFPFPPTAPADAPGLEAARLPYKELDGYNVELFDDATDPEMINNSILISLRSSGTDIKST